MTRIISHPISMTLILRSLCLKFSCPKYDRTEALLNGEVKPDGIELSYLAMPPADAHATIFSGGSDVSEMSLSTYIMLTASDARPPFTAIPVFPMRLFFHTELLMNVDSGIKGPRDLKGKSIGVQEYGMTLALWLRAIFQHEFGIHPSDMDWFVERNPGEKIGDRVNFKPPGDVTVRQVPSNTDLTSMLERREVDVIFPIHSQWRTKRDRTKDLSEEGKQKVSRLFPDPESEAIRYYRSTSFFPINHVIVVRNEVLEENPWVSSSLYNAFEKAKQISYRRSSEIANDSTNFVWLASLLKRVHAVLGEDPFPYGVESNHSILNAMIDYSYEQGLIRHKFAVSGLFHM